MQRLTDAQMIAVARQFSMKPRAICGEIAAAASKAADNHDAQCTAVAIFFRPSKATEDAVKAAEAFANQPANKKARTSAETGSIQLRHILVKHRSCPVAHDPVRNKPVTRTEVEAETRLREALLELLNEAPDTKSLAGPRK